MVLIALTSLPRWVIVHYKKMGLMEVVRAIVKCFVSRVKRLQAKALREIAAAQDQMLRKSYKQDGEDEESSEDQSQGTEDVEESLASCSCSS